MMINAFTVDVEDYYHVAAFADRIGPRTWDSYESRVVPSTHRMLALLDRHQVRATFFVLGWVADRFPGLVRDIHRAGHEVGCHSFWHRLVYDLTPDEFRDDTQQARSALEDITGDAVRAYRAPSFSITARSLWALDVLAELGFTADSSIYPVHHDRYGIPGAERSPHPIDCTAGRLWEFPASVFRSCGVNIPVSGGGYFRLYPLSFTLHCLRRINKRDGQPFMFYVHPWEIDADQPRLSGSFRSRLRHYVNLADTERKLDVLLSEFRFGPMRDLNPLDVASVAHAGRRAETPSCDLEPAI
jgi:polysaccharide deacetylase family protein (PEP-CTERM system associated)